MENYENNNVVYESPMNENPYGAGYENYTAQPVSKEEFIKNHASLNKTIKVVAIISYVLIGLNALAILLNFFVVIDIAILLGCTLGVHLKKKKGFVVGILVYGIFSVIAGLLTSAGPTGWMWIVFAIIYLTQFSKAEKEYQAMYGM